MEPKQKPIASLSLDLDNLWSYMKTHGEAGWESFPSYLDTVLPVALDAMDRLGLSITFFIVGQDAALSKNREALHSIVQRGHEVGNHSFDHEPWLHLYDRDRIRQEIIRAEEHIVSVTGQKPLGFRGPGFSWSRDLLEVLLECGYLYDASTLPTYIGPLARAYYLWTSDLSAEERNKRAELFGNWRDGLRPVKPYFWQLPSGSKILEIPVTTMPVFKVPFHLSYLIYLSRFSTFLMICYLRMAILMCRLTGTAPSFLLHPLDLIGCDQVKELSFFPGMDLPGRVKQSYLEKVLGELSRHFCLTGMSTHARHLLETGETGIKTVPVAGGGK
jgi:hypothetical protein